MNNKSLEQKVAIVTSAVELTRRGARIDDFAQEIALVRQNDELMAFLAERSKETERIPQSQVKVMLGLD